MVPFDMGKLIEIIKSHFSSFVVDFGRIKDTVMCEIYDLVSMNKRF